MTEVEHTLTIKITSASQTLNISPPIEATYLYLTGYNIKGNTMTGGTPDQARLFVKTSLARTSHQGIHSSSDGAYPLMVDGAYTSKQLQYPIMGTRVGPAVSQFDVRVFDEDGGTPLFSSILLEFETRGKAPPTERSGILTKNPAAIIAFNSAVSPFM